MNTLEKLVVKMDDAPKPNQIRLDEMIKLLKELNEAQEDTVIELQSLNKNIAVLGQALLKLFDAKTAPKVKKGV